jgi:hypothetical protein
MAAFKLCQRGEDPSLAIRNKMPKGRSATFSEGEAVRLVKRAWRTDHRGLACIIAVAWDAPFFVKYRQKVQETDDDAVQAVGTLSKRTAALIKAYLAGLGSEPLPDAPLFRNKSATAYSKDALCRSFRKLLSAEFPGDKRKLIDFRRSGAVEAQAGDVDPLALARRWQIQSTSRSSCRIPTCLSERRLSGLLMRHASADDASSATTKREKKLQLTGWRSCNSGQADSLI